MIESKRVYKYINYKGYAFAGKPRRRFNSKYNDNIKYDCLYYFQRHRCQTKIHTVFNVVFIDSVH